MSEEPISAEPGFDELLEELEGIVTRLEQGDLPLEQALERFEGGMALLDKAGAILEGAEMRVEQLLEARDGTLREVPLSES